MADGRMLKRNISNSRRLAELQTDSARMLWTWIIPHLDVEGRFYASPDLIKGKIVPRVKTFTEENIKTYIDDMATVGLIVLYKNDGELYLQYRKFDEFQNLRKDREGKPLPAPTDENIITPEQLPDNSGTTPAQVKLREVKLREAKAAPEEEKHDKPVDNSEDEKESSFEKPKEKTGENYFIENLKSKLIQAQEKFSNPFDKQKILVFVQSNHRNKNPDAIVHCLESLIKNAENVTVVDKYLEAALKIENGKYNASKSEARNNEFKNDTNPLAVLIGGIGKPIPAARGM